MNGSGNKVWKLFIFKRFSINKVAYANSRDKEVDFLKFTGDLIHKYFRLVADPIDIDFLTGDPFHYHADSF